MAEGGIGSSQVTEVVNRASNFVREASSNLVKGVISGKSNGVKDIQENLEFVAGKLRQTIEHLDPKRPEILKRKAAIRKTSSVITESEVLGRKKEKEIVINILLQSGDGSSSSFDEHRYGYSSLPNKRRKKENVSVLPIVGMGGLGKTTLAQMVYNDPRVEEYFQLKLWVCVRDQFDAKKVIKMIVKSATKMKVKFTMFDLFVLKDKVLSKKFLLILDDLWCEDRLEWQKLYNPISNGVKGSMILVTTRSPKVARITGTESPIFLGGLPEEPFWEFFKRCAFFSEDPEDYPHLVNIAKRNVTKLKGSPLAAKTLGALLSTELDPKHWRNIMNSEMWKFDQGENGIIPALRLSYQYLSAELRRCFSFCCMFPKDYSFDKSRMVAKWVAHDLIVPQGDEILEERGAKCFDELVSRSFFQSGPCNDGTYMIHDLMHDLAQSVSMDECFYIQASESQRKVPESIRHLSIARNLIEVTKLGKYSKLRSLEFLYPANQRSFELQSSSNFLFSQLTLLRMLDLRCCGINQLPESLGNMKHLRYLDLSHNQIEVLPESIEQLLKLQYLDISVNKLKSLPKGFTKLISLRKLYWDRYDIPVISGIGKLTSLQNLPLYQARRTDGQTIGELKDMTELYGKLLLYHLDEVEGKEEAARAMLINKKYLYELELTWSDDRNIDQHVDAEVLEGLQPHPNLKSLDINYYGGSKSPSWLLAQFLPYLNKLCIKDCANLITIIDLPPSLTNLHLENCPCFMSLAGKAFYHLTALQELYIRKCEQLKVIGGLNPLSLKNMSIVRCSNLMELGIFISESEGKGSCRSTLEVLTVSDTSLLKLPSLRGALASLLRLEIVWSLETLVFDGDDQELFQDLKSLTQLVFRCCVNLHSLPPNLHEIPSLRKLEIFDCPAIKSLPQNGLPTSLTSHSISGCNPTFEQQFKMNINARQSSH